MAFTALNAQPRAQQQPPPPPQTASSVPIVSVAHPPEIDVAFAGNPELRKRVHAAMDQYPDQSPLFRDISTYILQQAALAPAEPATKKRKIDDSAASATASSTSAPAPAASTPAPAPTPAPAAPTSGGALTNPATKAWRSFPGVSFSLPQRKKFTLELVDTTDGGIRAVNAAGQVEFAIACKDIDQVFCLPVPEKAKKQHNFIILPIHGDGVTPVPDALKGAVPEPILWTYEEPTGKNLVEGQDPSPAPIAEAIHHCMMHAGSSKAPIFPDARDFSSAIPESHRKGEKAYHVKAHRGSKEGYLFFTSVGILYGFKKPLAFFDFAAIDSISYTAVLRNTFNLVITTPSQEIEFGMLDQADFAGINDYVQAHGLQDASMAADRRAKKLNVNPPAAPAAKGSGANGTAVAVPDAAGGAEEEESELQKAERMLQDEEDDEEEDDDFDPGSEGESEGSGSDSEDDDDGEGGGYDEDGDEDEDGEDEEMEG